MCSAGTVGGPRPNTSSPARSGAQTTTAAQAAPSWWSAGQIAATLRGVIAAMTGRVRKLPLRALQRKPRGSPRCVMETFDSVNGPFLGRCLCLQCTTSTSGRQALRSGCTRPGSAGVIWEGSASIGIGSLIESYCQSAHASIRPEPTSPAGSRSTWARPQGPRT